jgi:hypothetical protein
MKYEYIDDDQIVIKTQRTETVEETFSLADLATEWQQLKDRGEKLIEDRAAFKVKITAICEDLGLTKADLIGLDDLEE